MFIYTNGHDDYGKREITLRKLLCFIKEDLETCDNKDDMLGVLSMLYNGDFDAEFIPNPEDMIENGVEYTGLDPVYYTPRISRLYNRQVVIIGDIYSERFSGIQYDNEFHENITMTRRYILNTKKIVCNLPFPLTIEDQNWIYSY